MIPRAPAYSERAAQWAHIAFGAAALLLRAVTWYHAAVIAAAAVLVNLWLFRRFRAAHSAGPQDTPRVPPGLVLYPAAILMLLILFPSRPDIVAASWAVLAFGDGAATLAGRRFGARKWPWHPEKTVIGSLALLLAGGCAASFLSWWCRPLVIPPAYLWFSVAAPFAAAAVAAFVETVPIRLDDNLKVPLAAATTLWVLSLVSVDMASSFAASLPGTLRYAIPANLVVAVAGYLLRTVSLGGASAGVLIGTAIFSAAGVGAWTLLLLCFSCAVAATRAGLWRKEALHIEEPHGGRRGVGNAVANTGVAAVAALLSVVSYADGAAMVALAAALIAGASDTVASEIGKAWGSTTWGMLPPVRVPPGSPGGMSIHGTVAGVVSAFALAAAAVSLGVVERSALVPIAGAASVGALAESLLASTFEPAGVLNNDALNLINTAVAAAVAVAWGGGMG